MDWTVIEFCITMLILGVALYPFGKNASVIIAVLVLALDSERYGRMRRRVAYLIATCLILGAAFTHACHLVAKMLR